MTERSGEIVMLKELHLDANVISKYVRVTGFAVSVDVDHNIVQLEHEGHMLYVDTSEVPASSLTPQALAQFIGEIRPAKEHVHLRDNVGPDDFYMKARIYRIVDGLDMELFRQTVEARREYLKGVKRAGGKMEIA
jgi:hypothetical protein